MVSIEQLRVGIEKKDYQRFCFDDSISLISASKTWRPRFPHRFRQLAGPARGPPAFNFKQGPGGINWPGSRQVWLPIIVTRDGGPVCLLAAASGPGTAAAAVGAAPGRLSSIRGSHDGGRSLPSAGLLHQAAAAAAAPRASAASPATRRDRLRSLI